MILFFYMKVNTICWSIGTYQVEEFQSESRDLVRFNTMYEEKLSMVDNVASDFFRVFWVLLVLNAKYNIIKMDLIRFIRE